MIKKMIVSILCISIIAVNISTVKVEASASVAIGVGALIIAIMGVVGVTAVNGVPLNDVANGGGFDNGVFTNDFYNKLGFGAKQELTAQAKLLVSGKENNVVLNNSTIKEIYKLINGNLVAYDESEDSRVYKFTAVGGLKDLNAKAWAICEVNGGSSQLGFFTQLPFSLQPTVLTNEWFLGIFDKKPKINGLDPSKMGNTYHTNVTLTKNGEHYALDTLGFDLVDSYILNQKTMSNGIMGGSDFGNKVEGNYIERNTIPKKVIGSFVHSSGVKFDIYYENSYSFNKDNMIMHSRIILPDKHIGITASAHVKCPRHNTQHDSFNLLSIYKNREGQYFLSMGVGAVGVEFCGSPNVTSLIPLDGKEYSIFADALAKKFDYDITLSDDAAAVGSNIIGLDDNMATSITVPISKDGVISIPDSISGAIPAVPDFPIDIPNFDTPLIYKKFPFSVPYDLYNVIKNFNATPVAPVFEVPLMSTTIVLDMSVFDNAIKVVRYMFLAMFLFGLIKITRTLIKG